MKAEFCDCNQRLNPWLVDIRIRLSKNLEPSARHFQAIRHPNVKFRHLDFALKASRQSLDDAGAEHGLRVRSQEKCGENKKHQEEEGDPAGPFPP